MSDDNEEQETSHSTESKWDGDQDQHYQEIPIKKSR